MIQVLPKDLRGKQARGKVSRKLSSSHSRVLERSTAGGTEPHSMPTMVKIRSRLLLDLLQDITHASFSYIKGDPEAGVYFTVDSDSVDDRDSFIFFHPFKLFIRYESDIRKREEALAAKFGMEEINENDPTMNETSEASEIPQSVQSTREPRHERAGRSRSCNGKEPQLLESRDAYLQMKLLIQLFDRYLKPVFALRNSLNNGEPTTITFENLWLLFDLGELVFVRYPGGKESGLLPRLNRVTHFTGGRLDACEECEDDDPREGSWGSWGGSFKLPKVKHDQSGTFYISTYGLESDGEKFGPLETEWWFPTWDGERAIHDLECFPVRFCRPGIDSPNESLDAWKHELVERGKQFSRLKPGTLREYHGIGVDENLTEQEVNRSCWKKAKIAS